MPFKDRAKRLQYINKYNGPYYAKNRLAILTQKQAYHRQHKEVIQAKMAARRKGKEEQAAANTRAWYAANVERAKLTALRVRLRNAYGIDLETYNALLKKQGGVCALCKTKGKQRLCVDHCHRTKKVRGLLCRRCNAGLGLLLDSAVVLARALAYLRKNK